MMKIHTINVSLLFPTKALWYKQDSVITMLLIDFTGIEGMEHSDRSKKEPIEIICPKCRYTEIIYLPVDDLPLCPICKIPMLINELLDEGKSY